MLGKFAKSNLTCTSVKVKLISFLTNENQCQMRPRSNLHRLQKTMVGNTTPVSILDFHHLLLGASNFFMLAPNFSVFALLASILSNFFSARS